MKYPERCCYRCNHFHKYPRSNLGHCKFRDQGVTRKENICEKYEAIK